MPNEVLDKLKADINALRKEVRFNPSNSVLKVRLKTLEDFMKSVTDNDVYGKQRAEQKDVCD